MEPPGAMEAEEGCTYSYDMYYQDRPVEGASGVAVAPDDDGDLRWAWSTSTLEATGEREFLEMHRTKTCAGESAVMDAVCTVVSVAPAAAAPAEGSEGGEE